jgi:hypothetical protein
MSGTIHQEIGNDEPTHLDPPHPRYRKDTPRND